MIEIDPFICVIYSSLNKYTIINYIMSIAKAEKAITNK